jgi:Amidohydrolase family
MDSTTDGHGMQEMGWTFVQLAEWLSSRPAAIAGLGSRKGAIAEGMDADLVIWAPYAAANTSAAGCFHRHKLTPYRDLRLTGRVAATMVRGAVVFNETGGVWDDEVCGSAVMVPSRPSGPGPAAEWGRCPPCCHAGCFMPLNEDSDPRFGRRCPPCCRPGCRQTDEGKEDGEGKEEL